MFTNLIIGIITLAGMIAYDWLHQKADFKLKDNVLKYAVAMAGVFFFSFIVKLAIWQYLQVAAAVVLIWAGWGIIASAFTSVKDWITKTIKKA